MFGDAPILRPLVLFVIAGGCLAPLGHDGSPGVTEPLFPACVHPYPCGDEWPSDLSGPFVLKQVVHTSVVRDDGVALDGWLMHPDLPPGVRAPVVLQSSPYPGVTHDTPESPAFMDRTFDGPVGALIEAGFHVAVFSVRGTGNSEGCVSPLSPKEQADQVALVEWLGTQPWSNGRVGMMGVSYPGSTPMEALSLNPSHLKAVVAAGVFPDMYSHTITPQGAISTSYGPAMFPVMEGAVGLSPPALGGPASMAAHVSALANGLCPEAAEFSRQATTQAWSDDRNEAFWKPRRLTDRFPEATAAVLLAQGFRDGLKFNDDVMWSILPNAPKKFVHGPWGHEFPEAEADDWTGEVVEWFDFWLKGQGPPPADLGTARFLDDAGTWRTDTAWPPSRAVPEALYLEAGTSLTTRPGTSSSSFRAAPSGDPKPTDWNNASVNVLCPTFVDAGLSLAWDAPASDAPVTIAGNPFAFLQLESDAPGGYVTVLLVDKAPDFACDGPVASGARMLTAGAADLRFAFGNFVARPFPTGRPTELRIDLYSMATTIQPGHRLSFAITYGDAYERQGQPYTPEFTLLQDGSAASSHVVLPVLDSTLGGSPAPIEYPPRPHLPPGAP